MNNNKIWYDKEELIKQYRLGKKIREIAKEFNCCTKSLVDANKRFGITPTDYNPRYKYRNKEWLQEQFNKYGNISNVAKQTGYPRTCLSRYAERYGIRVKEFTRHDVNHVNEDYFRIIDTANKAYFLGFAMADGNMYEYKDGRLQFSIKIKSTDDNILIKFKEDIEFEGELRYSSGVRNGHENKFCQIKIYNKTFCNHLVNLGIVPRKTGKELIPKQIPNKFIKDFIRGFIDGDGWVYLSNNKTVIGMCSTSVDIIKDIKKYLDSNLCINNNKIYKKMKLLSVTYTKQSDVFQILNHLYYPNCIALKRKQEIANKIIKRYIILQKN